MTRPRDSQRKKIYDAERTTFGQSTEELTLEEVQGLVGRVTGSSYWIEQGGPDYVAVKDGRGRRRGTGYLTMLGGEVKLPRFARSPWYVMHELAHILAPADAPFHGPAFARIYLELVERFVGHREAAKLDRVMRGLGVKRWTEAELRRVALRV